MKQKQTFKILLICGSILLLVLPFLLTFNSLLTEIINKLQIYRVIQNYAVPFESRIVVFVSRLLGVPAVMGEMRDLASFYLLQGQIYFPVQLQWNCLGWQSILFLVLSFTVGLQGEYTRYSKVETVILGLLGTFLINIFRMVFIVLGVYYINDIFALLIHDYFAAFVTIIWLIFFWWFSYKFILEEKKADV